MDLDEVQRNFDFAWEHTVYRANLVSLRESLGLRAFIHLPVDDEMGEVLAIAESVKNLR